MKGNKTFKFINLVIIFVCISAFLSTIPMGINLISRGAGVFTSYMHENEFTIEDEFYKSRAFDNNLINYLTLIASSSLQDATNTNEGDEGTKETVEWGRERLKEISNLNYFIINEDTNEIYTNTDCKTSKEFQSKYKGECDIKISSQNHNVSYSKEFNNKEYKNSNVNDELGASMQLKNSEIYMSIPKNFEKVSGIYDKVYEAKSNFNDDVVYVKVMVGIIGISLLLGIISTILYKINKVELFDRDSFWLKLSKFVPLELYGLGLFFSVIFITNSFSYYDMLDSFIFSFLGIGFILTVFYIFNKQIKSYDNNLDFFKTLFVYRMIKFSKITLIKGLELTRRIHLSKRIIGLAIICIGVNIFSMIIVRESYSGFIALIAFGSSLLTIGGFVCYILTKLWYLSYIMDGTERIKNGDIHHKLKLIGQDNFTTLADNINNIRDGLDKAIDNQLKSERMKSELITNVSHDLKTPLTSIINYIELIKKEEDISPEYLKDYVNVLDAKSKRLKVLIEDLFEASKASSGNIELNMEKIDLTQLLRQSIGEMEEKLSEANLDLKVNVPEDKTYVRADGRRLYRVLENLLNNISKYSLPNTRVYIDITKNEDAIRLTMKNISSYELNFDPEEIMERFKRADESRNTEGSGLGLAIARDLVNLQGGKFEIDIDGDLFKSIIEFKSIE